MEFPRYSAFFQAALLVVLLLTCLELSAQTLDSVKPNAYDPDAAMQYSQAAIGTHLGDYELTNRQGETVRLSDYAGTPLLISLIYTSCYHVCPVTTQYLAKAVEAAREVMPEDSFHVLTIGFDSPVDQPDAMRVFAREQGVDVPGWDFLSGSTDSIEQLVQDLGFIYFPSPRGFDHITQVTIVDSQSTVYAQVYGGSFALPWLIEPLKELVFNQVRPGGHLFSGLIGKVQLFCTVYDPSTGRYKFDYSLFIQIAIGLLVVLSVAGYLLREVFVARRAKRK